MKNRILITGSRGMLGARLVSAFGADHDVSGIDASTGEDLTDYGSLKGVATGFDCMVHCAASFEDDRPESILRNELVNSIGAINACRLALEKGCRRFCHISSISSHWNERNEYFNSYGLSKLHGEQNVRFFCESHGMSFSILRFSQMYDDLGLARKHQKMLYHLIERISGNQEVLIYGKANPERNYIHIDDVVEIMRRVVENGVEGIYDCVNPVSHTVLDTVELICRVTGNRPDVRILHEKENQKSIFIPVDMSVYEKIGYRPAISLETGVGRILDVMREQRK